MWLCCLSKYLSFPHKEPRAAAAAMSPRHETPTTFTAITLNHNEHHDSTLYRFEKGTRLQFRPGPSLYGREVLLYTNYVIDDEAGGGAARSFQRAQYYQLAWSRVGERGALVPLGGSRVDDGDIVAEITLTAPGPYHYYFVYEEGSGAGAGGPAGSGWLQVPPALGLPLGALCVQTVLAKCAGPLAGWRGVLRPAREAGYNMLHFSPVQRLGASASAYSIADQLRLDPRLGPGLGYDDLAAELAAIREDWGMLSICDVVLNHTANETPWLREHPEAAYNCLGSPHLRPAALLDAALARLSADVAAGRLEAAGVPAALTQPEQAARLRPELERRLAELRLHECYQCDVDQQVAQFAALLRGRLPAAPGDAPELTLRPDPGRRRRAASVDLPAALRALHRAAGPAGEAAAAAELRARLAALNEAAEREVAAHLRAAADNVLAGLAYERLQDGGPRLPAVSAAAPLAPPYFTSPLAADSAAPRELEAALWGPEGALVAAHNGWLMSADPLQDFAAPDMDGRVYLRRELIAWGDSVKLRYGARPEDSPFLWAHMRDYVRQTARVFDGLRLDNCHSTPLHVAEYLLDSARAVKPDLYVVAELFTNSDHVDNIFVNRLGITALIREALSAGEAREQGRLLHRYGGAPVGSLRGGAHEAGVQEAQPQVAPALLLDMTHDNPSPVRARTARDLLPSAALVAMAGCAVGSTRGYDELLPDNVHVVSESRQYAPWSERGAPEPAGPLAGEPTVGPRTGLMPARRLLNALHQDLAVQGYTEIFVDQIDDDVIAVTRQNPNTRESVVLVARTVFREERGEGVRECVVRVEGGVRGELSAVLEGRGEPGVGERRLAGLRGLACRVQERPELGGEWGALHEADGGAELRLRLPAGGVLAVRVSPPAAARDALGRLHAQLAALATPGADPFGLQPVLAPLDLGDLNALLYRCEEEERDAGGGGVYCVPGHGPLPYAGLAGLAGLLERVAADDDLGHAVCANLRAGDWLLEHCCARLEREPRLAAAGRALRAALAPVRALPRALRPAYAWRVWRALLAAAQAAALARLAPAAGGARRTLALCSVALTGRLQSAPLPQQAAAPSLSAGLPHFAAGHMRVWGRDTFIALRGVFLLTGRLQDARAHILGFAACLRHGLIPNLLDGGNNARFNCRDAVWWWLQSIQYYVNEVPEGSALLAAPVRRLFPTDDSPAQAQGPAQPLSAVMQEALQAHFEGRAYRERGAGRRLDAHMAERGFLVQLGVRPDTGFVFGGNEANCGTWMDKMGSSERAGNRGKPASPRDGSAVELVALCYSAVSWLAGLAAAGRYPHAGVTRAAPGGAVSWTWAAWAERLRDNFERHFWVPERPSAADARPDLVHRRGIYKDSHGASQPWADYQLRPNYAVAMCVAPALFDPRHAWVALGRVRDHLAAPLGLRTLDPADWNYRPDYRNDDDSDDPSVAHGFNYHQGPEWTWLLPFYCRALLHFGAAVGRRGEAAGEAWRAAGRLAHAALASPWRGLPELTDAGGAPCAGSCGAQAWSAGAALELLHALRD